jgi:2-oxoglutarate ferredoxin oxidoreductase subunit beta
VDIFSPCVTYNKVNTYPFFKERVYKLEDENWDRSDFHASLAKAFEWGDKIPLGVVYETDMPTYEDSELAFKKGALVKQSLKTDPKVWAHIVEEMI